ncbi:hypothetical protein BDW22DRAFT_1346703 [Trametopsis cervina]|nr:hypothetical protein BDW22DRAFT_1346703 [Trametopsis cervina]
MEKLGLLYQWLNDNPTIAQMVVKFHLSGRKRGKPYPRNTPSPSIAWANIASVLALSHLVIPSHTTAGPMARGVTELLFHHIEFPSDLHDRIHPRLTLSTKTLHIMLSLCGGNLCDILTVSGLESLICENVTLANVEWVHRAITESHATLRSLKLVAASHEAVFNGAWQTVPFVECRELRQTSIRLSLNLSDGHSDDQAIAEGLRDLVARLPPTLTSLSIELDCRAGYDISSYTSIIEKVSWEGVVEAVERMPGLRQLQSCTRTVPGNGFQSVRRTLLTSPRLSNAIRHLHVCGGICNECEMSPAVQWGELVKLLQVAPGNSPSLGFLLQAIPLRTISLCNVRLPTSTSWTTGHIDATNVSLTWMRPLHLDAVHAVPIFSSAEQIESFNMTDVLSSWLLKLASAVKSVTWTTLKLNDCAALTTMHVQLPMDFWFGEEDYYRRQRGLIQLIVQLPPTVTHFILEMSYYAWTENETNPHKPFATGMYWSELDEALAKIPSLKFFTVQWYAQEETAELLGSNVVEVPDGWTTERKTYFQRLTHGLYRTVTLCRSAHQYITNHPAFTCAMDVDEVSFEETGGAALRKLNSLLRTARPMSCSEVEDKTFVLEVLSAMTEVTTAIGSQEAASAGKKARSVLHDLLLKWIHTEWLHNARENTYKEYQYDLFEDLVFDLDIAVDKLWAQMKEKQIDLDVFDRQHARVQKIYNAIPAAKRGTGATGASTNVAKTAAPGGRVQGRNPPTRNAKAGVQGTSSTPNKSFDAVFEKYPKYIKDNFSKVDLLRTFPNEHAWPKPPYDKHFRNKGQTMCYIDNADCTTSHNGQLRRKLDTSTHLLINENITVPHGNRSGYEADPTLNRSEQSPTPAATDKRRVAPSLQSQTVDLEAQERKDLLDAVDRERRLLRAQLTVQEWLLNDLEHEEEPPFDAI